MKGFVDAAAALKGADLSAIANFAETNRKSMERVGTTPEDFGGGLTDVFDKIEEGSTKAKDAAINMADETIPKMDEMIAKGEEFAQKYGDYYTAVADNIEKVIDAVDRMRKALAGVEDVEDITTIFGDALGDTNHTSNVVAAETFTEKALEKFLDATGQLHSGGGSTAISKKKRSADSYENAFNEIVEAFNNGELNMDTFNQYSSRLRDLQAMIDYSSLAGLDAQEMLQNVQIDASFPNVESHAEIEEAIHNLINSASQYVNRQKA